MCMHMYLCVLSPSDGRLAVDASEEYLSYGSYMYLCTPSTIFCVWEMLG